MSTSPAILLVEDNDDHAELLLRAASRWSPTIELSRVVDGQQALDYLFSRGQYVGGAQRPTPKLVLLDLRLPKVDGLEVLRQVKGSPELHDVPVAILSTSRATRDMDAAKALQADLYIVKPLQESTYQSLLQQYDLCPPGTGGTH